MRTKDLFVQANSTREKKRCIAGDEIGRIVSRHPQLKCIGIC